PGSLTPNLPSLPRGEDLGGGEIAAHDAQAAYRSAVRGSRISRKPSPKRLKANTAKEIARPGKIARYGRVSICSRARLRSAPQSGVGGGAPRPKKDREAMISSSTPSAMVACTMIGDMQLGKTWRKAIYIFD